jgi:hypothetical protein
MNPSFDAFASFGKLVLLLHCRMQRAAGCAKLPGEAPPISVSLFCKISARRRVYAGGPGAGRVRLRPNRGFPRDLARDVTPYGVGRPIDRVIRGRLRSKQGRMTWETPALVGGRSPGRGSVRTGVSHCPSPDHVIPPQILGSIISHRQDQARASHFRVAHFLSDDSQ